MYADCRRETAYHRVSVDKDLLRLRVVFYTAAPRTLQFELLNSIGQSPAQRSSFHTYWYRDYVLSHISSTQNIATMKVSSQWVICEYLTSLASRFVKDVSMVIAVFVSSHDVLLLLRALLHYLNTQTLLRTIWAAPLKVPYSGLLGSTYINEPATYVKELTCIRMYLNRPSGSISTSWTSESGIWRDADSDDVDCLIEREQTRTAPQNIYKRQDTHLHSLNPSPLFFFSTKHQREYNTRRNRASTANS